jgi:hypothetical protein
MEITHMKINGTEVDVIYDPARGGWFAQRYPDCAVTDKCYRSRVELEHALETNSFKWDVD